MSDAQHAQPAAPPRPFIVNAGCAVGDLYDELTPTLERISNTAAALSTELDEGLRSDPATLGGIAYGIVRDAQACRELASAYASRSVTP